MGTPRRPAAEPRERASAGPDGSGATLVQWGDYEPAVRRWEHATGQAAPAPTGTAPKGGQRLSPRFVEWMMGLPAGWVTDTPGITRNEQLKMLGNGVVPQQAAAALAYLLNEQAAAA
jgi:DNA (cytosine-5)-methyltransferase 1